MPLMEWDDSFSVGVSSLDAQHRELVETIDEFAQAFFDGQSQKVMARILSRLIAFTKTHFQIEENLMIEYGYEDFFAHREEHKHMAQKVLDLQDKFERGERDVALDTFNFLRSWLMDHILKTDMAYREFFQEQGVE